MVELSLHVGNSSIIGWTEATYRASLTALAPLLSLRHIELLSRELTPIVLHAGDAVTARIGSIDLLSGYVDRVTVDYTSTSHTLALETRAKTGDLVDCSVSTRGGSWRGVSLRKIAEALCAPLDIDVAVAADTDLGASFEHFAVQPGETVYEALERAARMRGLLLQTSASGALVIGVPYTASSYEISLGTTAKEVSWSESHEGRYSEYRCVAQAVGTDQAFGAGALLSRTSTDLGISRYRPLVIQAESEDSSAELARRAAWESKVRAAKAHTYSVTVTGWTHDGAAVWRPGLLVRVRDAWCGVDDQMLVASVELSRSTARGEITRLELTGRHAYDTQPFAPPPRGGAQWS
jgi:prophage tail gpP-like protein